MRATVNFLTLGGGRRSVLGSSAAAVHHTGRRGFYRATQAALGTVVPFKLSDIGEGTLEVQILQWFVKPGDKIEAFDKICEVQTDKATDQISSPFDGIVRQLHADVGGVAKVGFPLIDVETEDADAVGAAAGNAPTAAAAAAAPAQAESATNPTTTTTTAATGGGAKPLATPAVRRIAMENNVDLRQVAPTGKGNRILKDDVQRFIAGDKTAVKGAASSSTSQAATNVATTTTTTTRADRIEVIAGVKKAMVKSMQESLKIPAFGAKDEIEMGALILAREELKPVLLERHGVKLSYMPFFIKAASLALDRFPTVNAHTNPDCTEVTYKGSHNIGFAMDTPNGLIVPNIKNVQDKSIAGIALDMQDLIERGRANKMTKQDLSDGTFTLSNIGSIGATYTAPVIFPPQVAIGALGRMVKVPRFDAKDHVYPAQIVNVSWSADHRVVDGATMVRFGNAFKEYVERPLRMLTDMK